jgi:VIT1/CCC1 family predicted Fe2+/Mn2+ transporter
LIVSLSVVLLLGALVAVLARYAGLRPWHAAVCALFGFYLASTSAAPYVRDAVRSIAGLLAGVDL